MLGGVSVRGRVCCGKFSTHLLGSIYGFEALGHLPTVILGELIVEVEDHLHNGPEVVHDA